MSGFHVVSSERGESIDLAFSADGRKLVGTLYQPAAQNPPIVFGSHGLLGTRKSPKQIQMARLCLANGWAFFSFDHRGCGESQGNSSDTPDFAGRCSDLKHAVKFILKRYDFNAMVGLFGSSMGGAVCLGVASDVPVHSLIVYAAPIRTGPLPGMDAAGELPVDIPGVPSGVWRCPAFHFDVTEHLSRIRHILIVHGDADPVVPVSHAREIYEAVGNPKKLMILKQGDHPMSRPVHQKQFFQEAGAWFRRDFAGI